MDVPPSTPSMTTSTNPLLTSSPLTTSVSPFSGLRFGGRNDPNDVKLFTNSREREKYDILADLYSIIKTTDALEKAYVRDAISDADYRQACTKLLSQFKTVKKMAGLCDVAKFMADYKLECPAGYHRLVEVGTLPPTPTSSVPPVHKIVAEAVQHFITLMDSLKLEMKAVDDIQPLVSELMDCLNQPEAPDFAAKEKVQYWLTTLNKMKATDELSADQIRQMLFDLNDAYTQFHKAL